MALACQGRLTQLQRTLNITADSQCHSLLSMSQRTLNVTAYSLEPKQETDPQRCLVFFGCLEFESINGCCHTRAQNPRVRYPLIPLDHFISKLSCSLAQIYFAQGRAKVGAALARGMALRAMGCSLLGVNKVFLRHIAPSRYGDQTLSSGAHLNTGHTHWRLALAA